MKLNLSYDLPDKLLWYLFSTIITTYMYNKKKEEILTQFSRKPANAK